jgi:hypothetical protein
MRVGGSSDMAPIRSASHITAVIGRVAIRPAIAPRPMYVPDSRIGR